MQTKKTPTKARPKLTATLTRAQRTELFAEAHPDHAAAQLAKAAADAAVPLSLVAAIGGVSRYSVYLWVCGDVEPRPAQVTVIRRLTRALRAAVDSGDLPAMDRDIDAEQTIRRHL